MRLMRPPMPARMAATTNMPSPTCQGRMLNFINGPASSTSTAAAMVARAMREVQVPAGAAMKCPFGLGQTGTPPATG